MPGIGGLSIANNLLANNASLNLNRNQNQLNEAVQKLSSGLRINAAQDDPSGLAIAESLQAQVNGFDQGARNVQDATNAATVAEGALQTQTDILQRIRTLAVQGASDITSVSDKQNLQAEINQLLLEVNRISDNTNFNGQYLLNGSHAGFQAQQAASATVTANSSVAAGGQLISSVVVGTSAATTDGTIEFQITQVSATQAALNLYAYRSDTNTVVSQVTGFTLTFGTTYTTTILGVTITLNASISTVDVGTTGFVKVQRFVTQQGNITNPGFNFQSGAAEGALIQEGFAATNTATLRIDAVNLIGPGVGTFSTLAASDVIGQIDFALQTLLGQRATLGAVIVRLQEDQNNDNIASTNLQASESNIRDLNVGQETTQYTKLQILVQVGTSVLAQSNTNAQSVLGLFR